MSSPSPKSFFDTSIVHKIQLGASQIQGHLRASIPPKWYVNNYVRMEFYRRSLAVWIHLYFESAEPKYKTFGDAWKVYSEGFGRESKTAVAVLTSMEVDGYSFSKNEDKNLCRQKLQDYIYSMALQFALTFTDTGIDPTHCARLRYVLKLPDDPEERDNQLLTFAAIFRNEVECRSRCSISNLFTSTAHRSKMDAVSAATAKGDTAKKLKKIQNAIETASKDTGAITCKLCSKMGDALIAVSLDTSWKLHSLDSVHTPICDALKLESQIHPSDSALAKLLASQPQSSSN